MTLRHAAALALMGWYMMTPQVLIKNGVVQFDINGNVELDTAKPLSKWIQVKAFDSAEQCEQDQESEIEAEKGQTPSLGQASLCVATDDPRLKEK